MKKIVKSVRGFVLAALVASAPAAAQVTLNASSWVSPGHPLTATMLVPLCADIEKATSARVKCNILPKAPVGAVQTFDGVKDGLMDLSFVTHGYTPGRFALTDAPEFPFMGDTAEVTAVAYQRIYERMLAGANEHKDVVLLSVFTHGPGQMYNTKRAINTLKDLDGLKIRVGGGLVNEITKNLGAVPMLKPAPESYELLSTGVADGLFFPKESPLSFKLVPLIKHVTYVPGGLYNVSFAWIANQAKWNQIPEADRKAIQPLLGEALRVGRPVLRRRDVRDDQLRAERLRVVRGAAEGLALGVVVGDEDRVVGKHDVEAYLAASKDFAPIDFAPNHGANAL